MKIPAFIFLLCTLFFLDEVTAQGLLTKISLENQIENSSCIVEGEVISKKSFWDANHHNIYTANTVKVYKIFKGDEVSVIEVITQGGTIGYQTEMVSPSLKLHKGDKGVFMLYKSNALLDTNTEPLHAKYRVYSSLQGFYKYDLRNNLIVNPFYKKENTDNLFYTEIKSYTNSDFIELSDFNANYAKSNSVQAKGFFPPSSIAFSPTTSTGGTGSVLTIFGSGFGASQGNGIVSFSSVGGGANTFVDVFNSQILSWSDTEITTVIPSSAGTGPIRVTNNDGTTGVSSQALIISYSELNVLATSDLGDEGLQTRHIARNINGGYVWRMHTDFNLNSDAKTSFLRAFETWRCTTGINWTIGAVTPVDVIATDQINIIRFDNGSELPTGILGQCSYRFRACQNGGEFEVYVDELDVVFDEETNWNFSTAIPARNEVDFETVALHELGHAHLLDHVNNFSDIMNFSISNGQFIRSLGDNNIVAANDIINRGVIGINCVPAMTTYSGACSLSGAEFELEKAVAVYPNPATTEIYIKNEPFIDLNKAVIYDFSGRKIAEYDLSKKTKIKNINLQGFSKGIYIINIHSNNAKVSKKLILD